MPTNVVMPQMGESVAEGTIVRWIKNIGDRVDRDEPLFEISTDKVDAEIPSPAAGTLAEVRVKEGETVPVDSVVAVIAQAGEATPPMPAAPERDRATPQADGSSRAVGATPETAAPAPGGEGVAPAPETPSVEAGAPEGRAPEAPTPASLEDGRESLLRRKSSPLVRKIAREHNVDITALHGTGIAGRVTKTDILRHIESGGAAADVAAAGLPSGAPSPEPAAAPAGRDAHVELVPMSVMRKKIAEHMVLSQRTSAHVHSVFEIDFRAVDKVRDATKAEFERSGTKLTYLAFIAKAVCDALRAMPVVNASIEGENIAYKKDINLGIAVALDWGLIVPVVKNADEKNLLGLSRAIADVANRARAKQLKPEDVQGGTFTITNPGSFGTLMGMPIINQPQVAILGVGAIEKRVVVIDDAIAIRPRGFLTLGYDHRLIDGAVADQFMARVKSTIESWDPAAV